MLSDERDIAVRPDWDQAQVWQRMAGAAADGQPTLEIPLPVTEPQARGPAVLLTGPRPTPAVARRLLQWLGLRHQRPAIWRGGTGRRGLFGAAAAALALSAIVVVLLAMAPAAPDRVSPAGSPSVDSTAVADAIAPGPVLTLPIDIDPLTSASAIPPSPTEPSPQPIMQVGEATPTYSETRGAAQPTATTPVSASTTTPASYGTTTPAWAHTPVAGHVYKLVNRTSGKLIGVSGASTADGAPIVQYTDNGASFQRWRLVNAGSGYLNLINVYTGKALDNPEGTTADGAQMQQWSIAGTGNTNQQWAFAPDGSGWYTIINRTSGRVLDVRDGSLAELAAVQQWTAYPGNPNQQWRLIAVS